MLSSTLVKCLRAVADTYHPSVLETAFPDHLFKSLVQLYLIRDSDTQLDVMLLWHRLVDHHGNKEKIPLTTYVTQSHTHTIHVTTSAWVLCLSYTILIIVLYTPLPPVCFCMF